MRPEAQAHRTGALRQAPTFGDEEESLSDVRSADARSAEIDRPHFESLSFQVSSYSVEPSEAVIARNLFTKDRYLWTLPVFDEVEPGRP